MNGSMPLPSSVDGRQWACIDLVSDLHLQAGEPATWLAFERHLQNTPVQALFVLGNLFEVWVGDDILHDPLGAWEQQCVEVLAQTARRLHLFWIPGNRDFLTGHAFAEAAGMVTLADPCRLQLAHETCLLSHGDAMCLQDHDYLAFRRQVRAPSWQEAFLARPLAQRLSLARDMRVQSQARQQTMSVGADVDGSAARQALMNAAATRLIHGHTHRPADHDLGQGLTRTVLSDWCLDARPPRAQVLRWQQGWQRINAEKL